MPVKVGIVSGLVDVFGLEIGAKLHRLNLRCYEALGHQSKLKCLYSASMFKLRCHRFGSPSPQGTFLFGYFSLSLAKGCTRAWYT